MATKSSNNGNDRKARLNKALRANLKRRKQAGKQFGNHNETQGELATRKAALAPKIDQAIRKDE